MAQFKVIYTDRRTSVSRVKVVEASSQADALAKAGPPGEHESVQIEASP